MNRIRREGFEAPTRATYEQSSWIESGDFNDAVVPKSYTEEDKEKFRQLASSLRGNAGYGSDGTGGYGANGGVGYASDGAVGSGSNDSGTAEMPSG